MDKDFIKENPLLTVSTLVLYFGACAGLWHIGFWSVFDVNYLQYIEISDIIKDFAQPAFNSAFSSLFAVFIAGVQHGYLNYNEEYKDKESETYKKNKQVNRQFYVVMLVIVILLLVSTFLFSDKHLRLFLIPMFVGYTTSFLVVKKGFLSKQIPDFGFRFTLVTFFVLLPLISFFHAKAEGYQIKDNVKYKIVSSVQFGEKVNDKVEGLKLIGASKTNLFLTDYCNNKMIILNMDNINSISYNTIEVKTDGISIENFKKLFNL